MEKNNQVNQVSVQSRSDIADPSTSLDCSKLSEGMVVKNYKEICKLLNEPIMTGGDSKKYQLKRWQCYFDYDKQGQKFIINEIFNEPFPNLDARKQKEGIYVKYIELLLMEYLMKQDGKQASLTKGQLYEMLGMVSPYYYTYRKNKYVMNKEVESKLDTLNPSAEQLGIFFQRVDQKLNSILTSALKSMANRFLIYYQTEYIISENIELSGGVVKNAERVADNKEISKILDVQSSIMYSMGYFNASEIFVHGKMKEFFNMVDDYVNEKFGWNYVYSHIKIIYLENEIKRQIPIKAEEIRKLSKECKMLGLNGTVVNSLKTQIQTKYEKAHAEYEKIKNDEWGAPNPMSEAANNAKIYSEDFMDIQKQLIDYLVKLKK